MQVYVNPLRQLRSEMDHLLGDIFAPALEGFSPVAVRGQPAVNLWDQGEELLLEMELPGVKAEQIDVSVAGDELTIKVERPEVTDEGVTYHRRERLQVRPRYRLYRERRTRQRGAGQWHTGPQATKDRSR